LFLSRAAEIALLALPVLDPSGPQAPGWQIQRLADATRAPRPFLAKVLQELALKGILRSKRGRTGGFVLGRPAAEITLADVVVAIEGTDTLDATFPPLGGAAGERLEPFRRGFLETLRGTTIADLRSPLPPPTA